MEELGTPPPGNASGNTQWSSRRQAAKPEVRLTPGKGAQDVTCPMADLIQQVVSTNKVCRVLRRPDSRPSCVPRALLAGLHCPLQFRVVG